MAHLPHRRPPHRSRIRIIPRRPRRKLKRQIPPHIRSIGQQSPRRTKHPMRQRRFLGITPIRQKPVPHRPILRRNLREFIGGRSHVQRLQNLFPHILLIRHPRSLRHHAPQQTKREIRILIPRRRRRRKWNPAPQPPRHVLIRRTELLVAPRIIFRKPRAMADNLPQLQRRRVARRQRHLRKLRNPLRHRVVE